MKRQGKQGQVAVAILTVEETAERLGMGVTTVYRHIKLGRIPSIKLGARVVVPLDAFNRWLASADAQR
jgi:excisionase family DNA binding protein